MYIKTYTWYRRTTGSEIRVSYEKSSRNVYGEAKKRRLKGMINVGLGRRPGRCRLGSRRSVALASAKIGNSLAIYGLLLHHHFVPSRLRISTPHTPHFLFLSAEVSPRPGCLFIDNLTRRLRPETTWPSPLPCRNDACLFQKYGEYPPTTAKCRAWDASWGSARC